MPKHLIVFFQGRQTPNTQSSISTHAKPKPDRFVPQSFDKKHSVPPAVDKAVQGSVPKAAPESTRNTPKLKSTALRSKESSTDVIDIEDTSASTGESVARARTAILDRIRTAAGLGGPAASATVQEFHRYLGRLRSEEDGPFQCLVAALLRFENHLLSALSSPKTEDL